MSKPKPVAERFWKKVKKGAPGECWEWQAHTNANGYGTFRVTSSACTIASRVAWELVHGPILGGLCVLHRCDNSLCCNPGHLFIGTCGDNNADRHTKGRTACGTSIPRAKLNEAAVVIIKELWNATAHLPQRHPGKFTHAAIGRRFGVGPVAVTKILGGQTWKHVP